MPFDQYERFFHRKARRLQAFSLFGLFVILCIGVITGAVIWLIFDAFFFGPATDMEPVAREWAFRAQLAPKAVSCTQGRGSYRSQQCVVSASNGQMFSLVCSDNKLQRGCGLMPTYTTNGSQ